MRHTLCFIALSFACVTACDLPDETTVSGCHIRLVGVNLHDATPWITARATGTCEAFDWARLEWHAGTLDTLDLLHHAAGPWSWADNQGCKQWDWPKQTPHAGEWYVLGTLDGTAVMDLSSDDIPFSDGKLPAYRWPNQPWTVVLFGGPECPDESGPTFPDPCPESQCPATPEQPNNGPGHATDHTVRVTASL